MDESGNVYQRLAEEQQAKAQKFMVWVLLPFLCVAGPLMIVFWGADRKSVAVTVLAYAGLAVALVEGWRKRRTRG